MGPERACVGRRPRHHAGVPAADLPIALWITLGTILLLLLLQFAAILRLGRRTKRLEQRLAPARTAKPSLKEQKAATREQKQWFEAYLDEEPARRQLPKKEQFAGYRRWRAERGLNWRADGPQDG